MTYNPHTAHISDTEEEETAMLEAIDSLYYSLMETACKTIKNDKRLSGYVGVVHDAVKDCLSDMAKDLAPEHHDEIEHLDDTLVGCFLNEED